jgi:hypothetical protein
MCANDNNFPAAGPQAGPSHAEQPRSISPGRRLVAVGPTAALVRGGIGPVRDFAGLHTWLLPARAAQTGAGRSPGLVPVGTATRLIRGGLAGTVRDMQSWARPGGGRPI